MTRFQSRCQRLVSGIPEPGMGDAIIEPYCRQAWNRWNVWKTWNGVRTQRLTPCYDTSSPVESFTLHSFRCNGAQEVEGPHPVINSGMDFGSASAASVSLVQTYPSSNIPRLFEA